MSRKEKKAREQKLSTRQLINTKAVSDYSLKTYDGDVRFQRRGQGVCPDECVKRCGGD